MGEVKLGFAEEAKKIPFELFSSAVEKDDVVEAVLVHVVIDDILCRRVVS